MNLQDVQDLARNIAQSISSVIRGKNDAVQNVVIALLSEGHVLLEDLPGTGKTRLARALAKAISAKFKRIQFTPDMLPNDVTGVTIYNEKDRAFNFIQGPIFANIILADEINRGTPRVQSALLECMSETSVTADGTTYELAKPFFVIATQNPIEFHGTYPLPEAQLDRFFMRLSLGYPDSESEKEILSAQVASDPLDDVAPVASSVQILQAQQTVRTVVVSPKVQDYVVTLMNATRNHDAFNYGCSSRAALALVRASQVKAAINGRDYVMPRDIRDLAPAVLAHRMPFKLSAKSTWKSGEDALNSILESLPLSRWERN